jgi:hypothetical protein
LEETRTRKSLLERTNSWKPFIDEVTGAINARDYRKETVAAILHMVDPALSMWPGSLWNYMKGALIGPGFPSGRECLYKVPFQIFLSRNSKVFDNAPLQAIQEFNRFVNFLFLRPVAETMLVNEAQARRFRSQTEQILYKGEQSKAKLVRWVQSFGQQVQPEKASTTVTVQKEGAHTPVVEEISQKPRPLFSIKSPLNEETRQLIEKILPKDHSEHDRRVISLLEQGLEKSSLRRQNFFITLTSPKFFTFKDLVDEAKQLPPLSFDEPFLITCMREQDLDTVAELINQRSESFSSALASILETADRRSIAIRRIQKATEHLRMLIQPFLARKETKAQAELLLNQLSTVDFPESLFKEELDVDKTIARKDELFKTISERVETEFRELINQQRDITRAAEIINTLLYAARWEMVSGTMPYPDLASSITQVRNRLLGDLDSDRERLTIGTLSLSQYATDIVNTIYEPDVRLIRGELTARSLRLKDLREAVRARLLTTDRHLALLGIAGVTNERLLVERRWMAEFFYKLLAPYNLFQYTYDPESINVLFRYWWLDFERSAKGDLQRTSSALHALEGSYPGLIRAIARTVDVIEKTSPGGRRRMYQRFIDATKNAQPSVLDHWLEEEALTIIGHFLPYLALIPQAEQVPLVERLLQIEQQMREITRFGKDIQAIKTFEPERINSLLEVLSVFPCLPSLDQLPPIRIQDQLSRIEQSLKVVQEELIIELGLLDKKSRMESGYAINNLIPQALLKATPILNTLIERFHELQRTTDPYVASIAHFLLEDASQLSHTLESVGFNQEPLFEAFQKLTVLLFNRKALTHALKPQNFASILLIPTATGQIVRRFRQMEAQGELSQSAAIVDSLDSIAAGRWNVSSPQAINAEELSSKLSTFITQAKRVITTSGLSERREARLTEGLEKVCKELSEESRFDIPRLSFVPGDLRYFWPTSP